ncbi:MAG: ABC transporter permease [Chloroflexi bacterium]|nr:ABC transporter permease [Chloroflexota bacterium]
MLARIDRQLGWATPLALVAVIVIVWEIAVRATNTPAWLLPAPSGVVRSLVEDKDILLPNALVTFSEVLLGFVSAVVVGVSLGITIYRSATLERLLYPIIIASQTVPIPALAPLLLVWFGYGLLPKVLVTALVGFFPIVVNTVEGLRSTDPDVINLLRSFGASRGKVFRLAEFPSSLPSVFAGARIAVAICVIGAVFGELVGAKAGLGYLITRAIAQFETPRLVAAIVLLSAMGTGLFALIGLIERIVLPWRKYTRASRS